MSILRELGTETLDRIGVAALRRGARGKRVEMEPQREDLANIVIAEGRHGRAAMRPHFEQAVGVQREERFTERRPADSEALADLDLE